MRLAVILLFMCLSINSIKSQTYVVNSSRAYFHDLPDVRYQRKGFIMLGDAVNLIEQKRGWVKVLYTQSNTKGWIKAELLSISKTVAVKSNRAFFYSLPYDGFRLNAYVEKGDKVQVLRELDGWRQVLYYGAKKNTVGWINNNSLENTDPISDLIAVFSDFSAVSSQKPKVWAVIVGVSTYSSTQNMSGINNLNYSDDDAFEMYNFLRSPSGGSLPTNQVILLTDNKATHQNIIAQSTYIFGQAKQQDLIIFYFSGHGGNNIFVAHDKELAHSEVTDILGASKANKKLCIADACHSGSLSQDKSANKSLSNDQMINNYYNALSKTSDGIALFLSSKSEETSAEFGDFSQGVFTYYYIQGLKGYADRDLDKIITIQELYDYTRENVENYTRQKGMLQRPQLKGLFDHAMPVGVSK